MLRRCITPFSAHIRRFATSSSPILTAISRHPPSKIAVLDSSGSHTYAALLTKAALLAPKLDPSNPTAIFLNPDANVVTSLLAIWQAGSIAVPLSTLYPAAALAPLLQTVEANSVITSSNLRHALPSLSNSHQILDINQETHAAEVPLQQQHAFESVQLASDLSEEAMVFFTSGTTGAPKGVVWTNDMLQHQLETLSNAWRWSSTDRILNVLPLHHIHGMVNVLLSALYNGAQIEMHTAFDAHSVWHSFLSSTPPSVFMAVPSIYKKLILHYEQASEREQKEMRRVTSDMRLFVCGSASLPKSQFEKWHEISGHYILERYGMTETGMTLSNDYENRMPGMLGKPLPGVQVKVDDGQLLVKGRGVFSQYWRDEEKTESAFQDSWFCTGDIVEEENGLYKLLGRASADIIKTGGYKVSSLEIEDVIREVKGVFDCSVIGEEDEVLGQRIVAALIVDFDGVLANVKRKLEECLPRYKRPREYHIVNELPRNLLGKVQKQVLKIRLGIQ